MPIGVYKHKPHTKNTRDKMSKAKIGNQNSLGYKFTYNQRKKLSQSKIGNKNALGYKHTKEACINMSNGQRGHKNALGYKHTKETKRKMSNILKGKYGKLSRSWQGGVSGVHYVWNWHRVRDKICKRDNNICQLCNKRKYGKELNVHHIDYNKKNCDENNLITLHRGCNIKVNTNRDYWFAYFTYIMEDQ